MSKALQLTERRGTGFGTQNTVFEEPDHFLQFGSNIISNKPVKTIQCTYSNADYSWTAHEIGERVAMFNSNLNYHYNPQSLNYRHINVY